MSSYCAQCEQKSQSQGWARAQDRGHEDGRSAREHRVTTDDDVARDLDGHGAAVNQATGAAGPGSRGQADGRLGVGLGARPARALGAHGLRDGRRLSDGRLSSNLGCEGRGASFAETALALGETQPVSTGGSSASATT